MNYQVINQEQIDNRRYWIDKITNLKGSFDINTKQIEAEINLEIQNKGIDALLDI